MEAEGCVELEAGIVLFWFGGGMTPDPPGPGSTAIVSFSLSAICLRGSFAATNWPAIALSSDWAESVLIPWIDDRYRVSCGFVLKSVSRATSPSRSPLIAARSEEPTSELQ